MKNIYQEAIDVQNACNASGVIHSLSRIVSYIWEEEVNKHPEEKRGTEYVNTHPVVILFLDKLCSLAHIQSNYDCEIVSQAYKTCYEKAESEKNLEE